MPSGSRETVEGVYVVVSLTTSIRHDLYQWLGPD